MSARCILSTASLLLLSTFPARAEQLPRKGEQPVARVGQIIIMGNTITRNAIILRQVPDTLTPGAKLRLADLRAAERNLKRLKVFLADPPVKVWILDREGEGVYKDICIEVNEKPGNFYFWSLVETFEFATRWRTGGLAAVLAAPAECGFPLEVLRFLLTWREEEVPGVASFFVRNDLPRLLHHTFGRCKGQCPGTNFFPPPALYP